MTLTGTPGRKKKDGRSTSIRSRACGQPDPAALLGWYDRQRRRLPWRALPGERAEPYRVWLSEIMLQQTTVKAVAPYYERFLARWPEIGALADAPLDDVLRMWAGLGYYARARNLHACAQAVARRHGGQFPDDEDGLRALPGVGAYTAAAIAAIAFDQRTAPVDGNVERVVARLFAIEDQLPDAKPRIRALAESLVPRERPGDFAQAMMDLGATICTPRTPACALCPWMAACAARQRGDQDTFPRKTPKSEGRLRRGAAFWIVCGGTHALLRTRPAKGLLGGMTEVPTTTWRHDFEETDALSETPHLPATGRRDWRRIPGVVTHTFTHFPLELTVYARHLPPAATAPEGTRWVALSDLAGEALPSVMRKVIAHAMSADDVAVIPPRSPSRRASAPATRRWK